MSYEHTVCPHCGVEHTAHEGAGHNHSPNEGDITICTFCAEISVFTDGRILRGLSIDEMDQLMADPQWRRLKANQNAAKALIEEMRENDPLYGMRGRKWDN